ncbi:hypothetical protein ACH4UV_37440 [Streptomyces sp. NPDC020802]|uniref:hypothetical protein n=1 Tax=Streptomyces sp. NPDC020802 TaxID=3365094 RepID=UPI0037A2C9B0
MFALQVWHAMRPQRIDDMIAALQQREAEQECGRPRRPAEPEWLVDLGIGDGRPPIEVHAGSRLRRGQTTPPDEP